MTSKKSSKIKMHMMRQILVAAAVLATLSSVVSGQPGFTFYKLSLMWPPSVCANPPVGRQCRLNIPERFTIHGFWPTLASDVPVRPYDIDPSCTQAVPTSPNDLAASLAPIRPDLLAENWPNLFSVVDLDFWKHEWKQHGMCSDYPTDPKFYFNHTLFLHHNFTGVPQALSIQLGVYYQVGQILERIRAFFGVFPEIVCTPTRQLLELRFCYNRMHPPIGLQDCPYQLTSINCPDVLTEIYIPFAPAKARHETGTANDGFSHDNKGVEVI